MKIIVVALICGTIAALSGAIIVRAEPLLAPLPISAVVGTKQVPEFNPVIVSPDGKYIVYALQDFSRMDRPISEGPDVFTSTGIVRYSYKSDVYVTNTQTGETENVSGGVGTSYNASWSPDSKRIAFFSDRDGETRLWEWNVTTHALRRISAAKILAMQIPPPVWADNGRKILCTLLPEGLSYSDENRIMEASTTHVVPFAKGSTIVTYSHEYQPGGLSRDVERLEGYDGFARDPIRDFGEIDVATGKSIILTHDLKGQFIGVSADGRYALTIEPHGPDPHDFDNTLFRISVIDIATAREIMSIPDVPMEHGISASWAPSGDRFAYITGSRSENQYFARSGALYGKNGLPLRRFGDVFVVDVGGQPENVSPGEHPTFSTDDMPVWSADGNNIFLLGATSVWRVNVSHRDVQNVATSGERQILKIAAAVSGTQLWQPDGPGKFFVRSLDTRTFHEEFDSVDIATGTLTPVLRKAQNYGTYNYAFDAPSSTGLAVFRAESATESFNFYVTQNFSSVRRITDINPIFERYVLGKSELISWTGKDGKTYHGTLLLPAGYQRGRHYPMIVWQRPSNIGSFALDTFGLLGFENWQLLATRGYAVFYPDFPTRNSREVQPLARQILFPGIDKVVSLGIADPNRLGVTGTSYGGYSTYVLVTMTDRFKAAMGESGPGNSFNNFNTFAPSGDAFRVQEATSDLGGTPWTARQNYINTSPFFFLDKVHTPVLIVHAAGKGDLLVDEEQVDQLYVGLRSLNKTVTMLLYEGGHGMVTSSYPTQIDLWSRVIAWFDRYVKNAKD